MEIRILIMGSLRIIDFTQWVFKGVIGGLYCIDLNITTNYDDVEMGGFMEILGKLK